MRLTQPRCYVPREARLEGGASTLRGLQLMHSLVRRHDQMGLRVETLYVERRGDARRRRVSMAPRQTLPDPRDNT